MLVSVVIPTLNEQDFVGDAIRSARNIATSSADLEVIVADGGSSDNTRQAAEAADAIIDAPPGRASQMNVGAGASRGSVLLFLHADSQLPENWLRAVVDSLGEGYTAGAFRLSFGASAPLLLRMSAYATRINSPGLCFGDRGLFVLRNCFERVGGFPPVRAFEDLEIVSRLAASGRFAYLDHTVTTSARRYNSVGTWRQQWRNVRLWSRYQLGAHPDTLAAEYRY